LPLIANVRAHVSNRRFAVAAAVALAAPIPLLLLSPRGVSPSVVLPELLIANWLYMAAPQLLVAGLALLVPRVRTSLAVPALVLLTVLLAAFQAWVWWWVPAREGALAWVLYLPFSAGALALLAVCIGVAARLRPIS
jgi:hypothetical protein